MKSLSPFVHDLKIRLNFKSLLKRTDCSAAEAVADLVRQLHHLFVCHTHSLRTASLIHEIVTRAVESVHKTSDSDSSIFKTPTVS
jgi:hypothetical protein